MPIRWGSVGQWILRYKWDILLVAGLTGLAALLRIYRLVEIPPGFHGDEGAFGMEARNIAQGELLGVWTPVALGHATGHIYWTAFIFKLGGSSAFTVRLSMAILGTLTVPVAYLLIRRLFTPRVAVIATALIAFSSWHLVFSRAGWTIVPAVFLLLTSLYFLFQGWKSGRWLFFLVGGILLGGGFYTHKNFPVYYAGVWAFTLLRIFVGSSSRHRKGGGLFLLSSLIVAIPFLVFLLNNWEVFTGRLSIESFFQRAPFQEAEGLGEKAGVVARRIGEVFLYVHNSVPRDFVDGTGGRPLLDRVSEAFFWLGLLVTIARIRRPAYQLVAVGLLAGSVPPLLVVTGEQRRLMGALPFVMVSIALGLDLGIHLFSLALSRLRHAVKGALAYDSIGRGVAGLGIAGFLAYFSFINVNYYFGMWASDPAVRWVYAFNLVRVVDHLESLGPDTYVYFLSQRWSYDYETRRFLLPDMQGEDRSKEFAGAVDLERRHGGKVTYLLLEDYVTLAPQLEGIYPGGDYREVEDSEGGLIAASYTLPEVRN